jgi:hypothetical protein
VNVAEFCGWGFLRQAFSWLFWLVPRHVARTKLREARPPQGTSLADIFRNSL